MGRGVRLVRLSNLSGENRGELLVASSTPALSLDLRFPKPGEGLEKGIGNSG